MTSISRLRSVVWKRMIKKDPMLTERYRQRLIQWRSENSITRVDKPTRIERARALGFRENTEYIVVRARIRKGAPFHSRPRAGRRPKKMGINKITYSISNKKIAENRVARRYRNMRVTGSYLVGQDGRFKWYEVVLTRRPDSN